MELGNPSRPQHVNINDLSWLEEEGRASGWYVGIKIR
jgi:hypothetical protein